ncbi:hypothetical protein HPP92_003365 [Vanilla planifolia]|uniref:GRAM domain-containing protein n=1 Tax=Vanilla planifolia TaxID=51239 RepID=A0A835S632_VANPL|nr:hypothetical protein HPP92_003365 [Vanilla planifolia]
MKSIHWILRRCLLHSEENGLDIWTWYCSSPFNYSSKIASPLMAGKKSLPHDDPLPPRGKDGEVEGGTSMMGNPLSFQSHPANQQEASWLPVNGSPASFAAAYKYDADYSAPSATAPAFPADNTSNNPYVQVSPVPGFGDKSTKDTISKVLVRCGKKLEDSTRKAGDLAGNVWHHLKTGPSITDAAMARLAQGTKVLAEGGSDKMFQQTFGIHPGEHLQKAFACYLSTSSGPVIGTMYLSTFRLAFCSDNPICRNVTSSQQDLIYYKVVIQFDQLKAAIPSSNSKNAAEKYIHIVTYDNHEFWFMGFVSYDKAVKYLKQALERNT